MKIFSELIIKGTEQSFKIFLDYLKGLSIDNWKFSIMYPGTGNEFYDFEYTGKEVPKAAVALFYKKNENYCYVSNIIPIEKNELSTEEYNLILSLFYRNVLEPISIPELDITAPTSDTFHKEDYLSSESLHELEYFSLNKSTGSTHPADKERWYDFIIRVFETNEYERLNGNILSLILSELGFKSKIIDDLISEFEFGIGLLKKYRMK